MPLLSGLERATKERDAALDALDEWYVEFRELPDDAELLEALGLGSVA